jgi:hypothetical protein
MSTGAAYELLGRLVAAGGFTFGTDLFLGKKAGLPGAQDPRWAAGYVVVTETGGAGAVRTQGGAAVARPTFQLAAAAKDAPAARAALRRAWDALGGEDGLANVTLAPLGGGAGTLWQRIAPRQGFTDIGPDPNAGAMFSFNIEAMKQPS